MTLISIDPEKCLSPLGRSQALSACQSLPMIYFARARCPRKQSEATRDLDATMTTTCATNAYLANMSRCLKNNRNDG